ncbi:MAG: type II toxin-antitoxin system PemK/MazF family toxin [Polyangiaceae bacterium]
MAPRSVEASYDAAAEGYAAELARELERKPFDRHALNRFAEGVGAGRVVEVGCGPGQVAAYLAGRGVNVVGIDLSPRMIEVGRRIHPGVELEVGDMTSLGLPDGAAAGVVSFYSIVHFAPDELVGVFRELRRVLAPGGLLLVAFHVARGAAARSGAGDALRVDELFGAPVELTFHMHAPDRVIAAMEEVGFDLLERTVRAPYPGAEYASRRCYLLAARADAEPLSVAADAADAPAIGHGPRRGDVYWIPAGESGDSAQNHPHPHVVVSDDVFNESRIATIVVCALTSNLRKATEPGNVPLEPGEGGLPKPSVVLVSQVTSIEKGRLGARIGALSAERVDQIVAGLRFQQRSFFDR